MATTKRSSRRARIHFPTRPRPIACRLPPPPPTLWRRIRRPAARLGGWLLQRSALQVAWLALNAAVPWWPTLLEAAAHLLAALLGAG